MPAAQPVYLVVADDLRRRMRAGDYAVGEELPKIDDLVNEHKVSHMTVKRALEVLAAEGLVKTRQGKRAIVTGKPSEQQRSVQDQLDELREHLARLDARTRRLESHVIE